MDMTLVNLVKFCTESAIEIHKSESGVAIFIYHFQLVEFMEIFKGNSFLFDEEGIECVLKEDYLFFELADFLPDLEPDEIQEVFVEFSAV